MALLHRVYLPKHLLYFQVSNIGGERTDRFLFIAFNGICHSCFAEGNEPFCTRNVCILYTDVCSNQSMVIACGKPLNEPDSRSRATRGGIPVEKNNLRKVDRQRIS